MKRRFFGVDIPQGQLTLEDCDITSDDYACVNIRGAETVGILRHCRIHDGKQSGIYVKERGRGVIADCDIYSNTKPGISIASGGDPAVQGCRIYDGKESGIFVCERGSGQHRRLNSTGKPEMIPPCGLTNTLMFGQLAQCEARTTRPETQTRAHRVWRARINRDQSVLGREAER
jgi:parallel beta-helix repeat protein